ncbi:MAG: ACT domain-containing protein [Veillonellaceae bacterium]|nr:ACT domain-containing protein [Veillonellaceae bacterium]MDD6923697.1 ACT domain-containing protein [Veillonellaceae bacterium]
MSEDITDKQYKRNGFFLVREEILPEAIKKTIKVKEMLKRGEARTINEAVDAVDLSRSAYYKYKEYVFPFYEASRDKIVTISFLLEHRNGVLSQLLNIISQANGSVLTINQGIPLQGVANATVSFETAALNMDLEALIDELRMATGVRKLEILGQV